MKIPRVKEGDLVSVELFNALIDAANGCGVSVGPGSGLILSAGPAGSVLGTAIPTFFWAKTTGAISAGKYPWTHQRPATGGAWTAGNLTGTAYEVNGSTSVATGTYIKVWRTADGSWRFNSGNC